MAAGGGRRPRGGRLSGTDQPLPPPLEAGARLLALDVGDARIGLAIGTVGSLLALGRGVLTRQGTRKDVATLLRMLADDGAAAVIVGLPVRLGGEESAQTDRVRRFAAALESGGARVEFEDERLTTRIAQRQVGSSGLPRSRRQEKGRLDEAAAVLILESYLRRVKAQA